MTLSRDGPRRLEDLSLSDQCLEQFSLEVKESRRVQINSKASVVNLGAEVLGCVTCQSSNDLTQNSSSSGLKGFWMKMKDSSSVSSSLKSAWL